MLADRGDLAESAKTLALFEDTGKQCGAAQFKKNVNAVRIVNRVNAENRNNKQVPYEVEDAFALTLKNEGINLPVGSLRKISNDFKPSQ